ncbi:MAG: DNA mismatch repair protein MutS, partial [Pseudomonadota bacterium]|nr:DNA mismatch repair protein MutS [Pseudomonadota bacterium]MEC8760543.1 DNA mismatch repair protein MutS [Pseudomonadota bacterium]
MQTTPVIQQYLDIKANHQDSLLFFRMGDFYELFFSDAEIASDALNIILTKRGQHKGKDIPMCGVPFHSAESYIKKLLDENIKVAICEQLETPQEAKKRGYKAIVKRDVVRIITPGTKLEESFLIQKENNILMAIFFFDNVWSSCWIDISTGLFKSSITDESQLLSIIDQISPNETISYKHSKELNTLTLSPINVTWLEKKKDFSRDTLIDFLSPFFDPGCLQKLNTSLLGSICLIVEYLQKNKNLFLEHYNIPEQIELSHIMSIDPSTRKNLEINSSLDGEKNLSLLGVVDKTCSLPGSRLLKRRLNAPSTQKDQILKWQRKVTEFYYNFQTTEKIRTLIGKFPDTERALSRLIRLGPNPKDLLSIKKGFSIFFKLKEEIKLFKENSISLEKVSEDKIKNVLDELVLAIEEEPPLTTKEGGFIRENFSDQLHKIKLIEKKANSNLLELQKIYSEKTGIKSLKLKYNNVLGYFFEAPISHKNKLLEDNEFFHRQTTANTIRIKSISLDQLEKTALNARNDALELEIKILEELHKKVLNISKDILFLSRKVSSLDVCSTLGYIAKLYGWCCPLVDDSKDFIVKDGRHSVIEKTISNKSLNSFVPNDCSLSSNEHLWLITGPNMAGKSTFLRQNAHIIILAQIGSYVPAKKAKIGIANKLFSRIGASDNISKGQSTFMVEMLETSNIIKNANEKSFVILDEIGRGTSTFDGLAIAWAIIERLLRNNKSRTLFATHYHELTELENENSKIRNVSCEIKEWKDEIIYSYKVIDGKSKG